MAKCQVVNSVERQRDDIVARTHTHTHSLAVRNIVVKQTPYKTATNYKSNNKYYFVDIDAANSLFSIVVAAVAFVAALL